MRSSAANRFASISEYTADVGIKKNEKVDYAIIIDGEPLILVEAKPANSDLTVKMLINILVN